MSNVTKWRNVRGTLSINLARQGNELIEEDGNDRLSFLLPLIADVGENELLELVIEFTSTGEDDPGSMYGGADNLGWPPCLTDERAITTIYIERGDKSRAVVPESKWWLISDFFCNAIDAAELDPPPERDY